jgi:hypothetical protein
MRLPTLVIGLAVLSPVCAQAQTAAYGPTFAANADPLAAAVFANHPGPSVRVRGDQQAAAFGEQIVTPVGIAQGLSGQPLPTGRVAAAGEGLIGWRETEVSHAAGGGAVDSLRMSVAEISRTPLVRPGAAYEPGAVDMSYSRGWPNAMLVRAGDVGLNVSPHAGIGLNSGGGNHAEAGAMFRFSSVKTAIQDRLTAMGVKNGSTYGDQGRWYVFAAVRGQSVGLNMMSGATGALRQAGWSTDASSALVGDGQVGVGWRKGGMEASLGYVHRGIKVRNAPYGSSDSFSESLAAMSLTFHPSW